MEASALPTRLAAGRAPFSAAFLRLRSDEQLVAMFRAGSDEAFRAIHDRYRARLLPDYVLLRYRDLTGVRYLRDIPLKRIEVEIASHYHRDPQFARAIADHLAGMTDSSAVSVYDTMFSPSPRRAAGAPLA